MHANRSRQSNVSQKESKKSLSNQLKRKQLIAYFGIAYFGIAYFGIAYFDFGNFGAPQK
jgi:hypothetical protein